MCLVTIHIDTEHCLLKEAQMNAIFAIFDAAVAVVGAIWHSLPQSVSEIIFLGGLSVVGAMASFVNMLSGGGSMLVLGLMMLAGIDPVVANATNRVGVCISTATGAAAFRGEKAAELRESIKLGLWSIPGAIAGAFFSVRISGEMYEKILAVVMIIIVASMFLKKRTDSQNEAANAPGKWVFPAMLLVGFYGGAIQVGVGIVIFGVLRHLAHMKLMRINVHRVFIVFVFSIPSLAVFIWSGKINWSYAAALCIGSAIGSWVTVKWTLKKGEKVIRIGLAASVVLMSLKFLIF